jgi:hypothetical protein
MLFGPAFSPDGTLALGTYSNQPSRLENIVLLDVRTRRAKEVLPLTRRGACPAQLTFSPNGEYLAAAVFFDRAPVYLWRLEADSKSRAGR